MDVSSASSPKVWKRVGIAVVVECGRTVVGLRPKGTVLEGLHEFPGGKCLDGESPADCAIRECREETGLTVQLLERLHQVRHIYPHADVELSFFLCRPVGATDLLAPFQWIPVSNLADLSFPEANQEAVARLFERLRNSEATSHQPFAG